MSGKIDCIRRIFILPCLVGNCPKQYSGAFIPTPKHVGRIVALEEMASQLPLSRQVNTITPAVAIREGVG
jgi:hypothetical protein